MGGARRGPENPHPTGTGFPDEYADLALLAGEVRAEIKSRGIKVNCEDWQQALDLDVLIDLLRKNDGRQARSLLLSNLKALQR